ncbi:hypothetical protein [Lacticaseibacillus salsurivasis]|uniref:hypothetical protein n=1 Tax=Lacticaseibacillus salsurivasis TaxID=3081441 RepID=UPI0030C75B8D
MQNNQQPLRMAGHESLHIEYDSMTDVPTVMLNGERIDGIVEVHVDWKTRDDSAILSERMVSVTHFAKTPDGLPYKETITHRMDDDM